MPDIKVVVEVKGDRATIGVQAPNTDPVIESIAVVNPETALDIAFAAAGELVYRAQERWAASPQDPAYQRPPPPPAPAAATPAPRTTTPARAPEPKTSKPKMF